MTAKLLSNNESPSNYPILRFTCQYFRDNSPFRNSYFNQSPVSFVLKRGLSIYLTFLLESTLTSTSTSSSAVTLTTQVIQTTTITPTSSTSVLTSSLHTVLETSTAAGATTAATAQRVGSATMESATKVAPMTSTARMSRSAWTRSVRALDARQRTTARTMETRAR